MSQQASPMRQVQAAPTTVLDAEFFLDSAVALRWVDGVLARCSKELLPADVIYLLRCRAELAGSLPSSQQWSRESPHPICDGLARTGVRQIVQHERARAIATASTTYGARLPATNRVLDELWNAAFAPTNLLGTLSNGALLLDSLYHSLPATWHVRLQGGAWELYDANKAPRTHAFGKVGKAAFPVRMVLRAKGARLNWLSAFRSTAKGAVAAVPGAKTIPEALRVVGGSTMKLISGTAYSALPLRGVAGGNAVGLAITVGPQMFVDAREAGLFANPKDEASWKDFAIRSANSQSGNMAGVAAAAFAGALVATIGVSAPILIVAGLAGGIVGQGLFNAWGLNEDAERAARWLFDR